MFYDVSLNVDHTHIHTDTPLSVYVFGVCCVKIDMHTHSNTYTIKYMMHVCRILRSNIDTVGTALKANALEQFMCDTDSFMYVFMSMYTLSGFVLSTRINNVRFVCTGSQKINAYPRSVGICKYVISHSYFMVISLQGHRKHANIS